MYFPYNDFKKLKGSRLALLGIGVTIVQHRRRIHSVDLENTPAARLGLRYGDRIVWVDGKTLATGAAIKYQRMPAADVAVCDHKVERPGSEARFTSRLSGIQFRYQPCVTPT